MRPVDIGIVLLVVTIWGGNFVAMRTGALEIPPYFCKKKIFSYVLNIKEEDIILDAAGGSSSYLEAVRLNSLSSHLILTDQIYEGVVEKENGIKIVGGDISSIHLDDSSVTKISCHHAFEHFQENKDQLFIKEAYRILKKSGCLVIIPLFLTDKYSECWNIKPKQYFDKKSNLIFDSTATLPGGDAGGHFCRLYSVESLEKRILNLAKDINFDCEIIECEIDHQSIPKSKNNCGSKLNAPTRALKLTKI